MAACWVGKGEVKDVGGDLVINTSVPDGFSAAQILQPDVLSCTHMSCFKVKNLPVSRLRLESKAHEEPVNFASDKRRGLASRFCCHFSSRWNRKPRNVLRGGLYRLHSASFHMLQLIECPLGKQKLKGAQAVCYHTFKVINKGAETLKAEAARLSQSKSRPTTAYYAGSRQAGDDRVMEEEMDR